MATLSAFQESQWSIDYQSAVLEPDSFRRSVKTDVAVATCIDVLKDGALSFSEWSAVHTAMRDLMILRGSYYKYGCRIR
jgi:hypothetical protein